jgi:uncharacterized membrane protein
MNDQHLSNKELVADGWGAYSVIAVSFEDDHKAYNALTVLKELDSQKRVGVQEAVVVVRGEDGQVVEKDRVESMFLPNTAGGGLIGLLLGIIGGPLGMLIGSAGGLVLGSLFDLSDVEETESALGAISSNVQVGRTSLLAVVTEQSPEVIDAAMSEVGGTVLRRPVADVKAEIAAAGDVERKAKWEARKELARSHREHDKAAVDAKLDQLKTKLNRGQKTPA